MELCKSNIFWPTILFLIRDCCGSFSSLLVYVRIVSHIVYTIWANNWLYQIKEPKNLVFIVFNSLQNRSIVINNWICDRWDAALTRTVLSQIFKNLHRNSISATLYILIYLFHKAPVTHETPTQMLKPNLKDKIWVIFQCQLFYLYCFLETCAISKNRNASFLPCIFLYLFRRFSLLK